MRGRSREATSIWLRSSALLAPIAGTLVIGCSDSSACDTIDDGRCNAPDLTLSEEAVRDALEVGWVDADRDPCLVEERCVGGPGLRRVLFFNTVTPNIGTGDLVVGKPSMGHPDFEYSACHNHYHYTGYVAYSLLDGEGQTEATGHKQSFCLRDNRLAMHAPDVREWPFYGCKEESPSGGVQGISRGWSDAYDVGLRCQWLDITGVPAGDYLLRIRVNPDQRLYELRHDNNEVLVAVSIP